MIYHCNTCKQTHDTGEVCQIPIDAIIPKLCPGYIPSNEELDQLNGVTNIDKAIKLLEEAKELLKGHV